MKFFLFSKTRWREPSRLRHQVAKLLASHSHEVFFFQKPLFPMRAFKGAIEEADIPGVVLLQSYQLIHHQLRVVWVLAKINSMFEKFSIRKLIRSRLDDSTIIINFNYDYFFLREIFPKNKIITIINDDFVAQAKFNSGRHASRALQKTCENSDEVLTVSTPILDQLSRWSKPKLFLPWADSIYKAPARASGRDAVLLWAHLDKRVDYALLREVALMRRHLLFYLVGPQSRACTHEISGLAKDCPNVVVLPPTNLDSLPLDRFFAALIPYRKNVADIEAVTLSNKSFQLMCRGLPLIVLGMPYFFEHEAISKCEDSQGVLESLEYWRSSFDLIQNSISRLVGDNQASSRYAILVNQLNNK